MFKSQVKRQQNKLTSLSSLTPTTWPPPTPTPAPTETTTTATTTSLPRQSSSSSDDNDETNDEGGGDDVFLDIFDHFRAIEKLENVNIFVSRSHDKHLFRAARRTYARLKHISTTNELLNSLRKLAIYEPSMTSSSSSSSRHMSSSDGSFYDLELGANFGNFKSLHHLHASSYLARNDHVISSR